MRHRLLCVILGIAALTSPVAAQTITRSAVQEPGNPGPAQEDEHPTYMGRPVPYWVGALKADGQWLRWRAVRALRHLRVSDADTVKALAITLDDKRVKIRLATAESMVV